MSITTKKDDVRKRTLYIRFPRTIGNSDDVRDIVTGDVKIKLYRQAARHCFVEFSSIEEKKKNLKAIKKKMIDNKPIFVRRLKLPGEIEKMKKKKVNKNKKKKITVVKPNSIPTEIKVTHMLYVSNIHPKTNMSELKTAFVDCKTAVFINNFGKSSPKEALVKLSDPKLAAEYLRKERPTPVVRGMELVIKPDRRKQKRRKKSALKIYDSDGNVTDEMGNDTTVCEQSSSDSS